MAAKITQYTILKSTDDIVGLEQEVNKYIAQGWEPSGGVTSGTSSVLKFQTFYQAMIKREE